MYRSIPDIATWIEVYKTYMAVLGAAFPRQFPELVTYQLLIVQYTKSLEYPSWLHYDTKFRQLAASHNFHTWLLLPKDRPKHGALSATLRAEVTLMTARNLCNNFPDSPLLPAPSLSSIPRRCDHRKTSILLLTTTVLKKDRIPITASVSIKLN